MFPGWAGRFSQIPFRELVTELIAEASPAHIKVTPHWFTREEMFKYEHALTLWVHLKLRVMAGENVALDEAAAYLIHLLPIDDVNQVGIEHDLEIERSLFVFYDI